MRLKALACLLAALAVMGLAHGKNFGVLGPLYPIIEVDIRQLVLESAARADWAQVQEQVRDSAKQYLDNLPRRSLPVASHTNTQWIDPSIVLASDIQAPVRQADGSFRWEVFAAKGTRFNPLSQVRPRTVMFFYDGSNEQQIRLLKRLLEKEPLVIVPVEAGAGSVRETSVRMARPIFHASDALLSRFRVRELPSLVFPGDGARSLYIGVTALAEPFDPQAVLSLWSGFLSQSVAESPNPPAVEPR